MVLKPMRLGEMLIEAGLIDSFQLNAGLAHQRNRGGRLGAALVKLGYLNEERLLSFLAEQHNCSRIDFRHLMIPPEVLMQIPAEKARQYTVVPIEHRELAGCRGLVVAMSDPTNLMVIDSLQFLTGCRVRPAVASDASIRNAIDTYYGPDPALEERLAEVEPLAESDPDYAEPSNFMLPNARVSLEEKHQALLAKLHELGILTRHEYEELK
jgi:type IV pilus assembly protein PilB